MTSTATSAGEIWCGLTSAGRDRLCRVGDTLEVDGDGLRSLAARCETAATSLTTTARIPSSGPSHQLTAAAVTDAHALVRTTAEALAARASSTGTYLRIADGVYRTTDAVSARNLGAVDRPVEA